MGRVSLARVEGGRQKAGQEVKQHEERPAHLPVVEFVTPYGMVAVGGCETDAVFRDGDELRPVGDLLKKFFAAATESWRGQVPVLPQIKESNAA